MRESDEKRWSALMASAQAGNQDDYRVLLQELGDVIHRFLVCRFGQHHFIEDCVQESLMALHRARHTYDPFRPFRPWLFAIVRHKTIDILRSQRHREKAADDFAREQAVLAQTAVRQDVSDDRPVEGLLERLPEPHREILVLTKVIGYSMAEASRKLGISQGAAKVRTHRAIRKLRQLMDEEASTAGEAYP